MENPPKVNRTVPYHAVEKRHKRYTFITGLKHKYHHRQSCPQISIQTKLCQNAAFPEALGTFSNPRSRFSLMLCMVTCHLYANACVYNKLSSDELYLSHTQIIMRSEMCSLHLTHSSVHTWSSGQPTVQRPGSSRGLPARAGIRTHNLGLQVQRSIR